MDQDQRHSRYAELAAMRVWVVVPMYRVRDKILSVLASVPAWVEGIVAVDDACPEKSADFVEQSSADPRVEIIRHPVNQGVGGAVLSGFRRAIDAGARIVVKVDGDGQMDLRRLPALVLPISQGKADYTKGMRFSSLTHVEGMPLTRVIGNSALSMLSKISSGYWNIFDPTNGYVAIEARVASVMLERRIAQRYFFESDMLYHLGTVRAVVMDVSMPAIYRDERSSLDVPKVIVPFLGQHVRNTLKRFVGQYLVRDFSVATIEFLIGLLLFGFGLAYGAGYLLTRESVEIAASPGIVMGVALPIIIGLQLLLAAINYDVLNAPREPIHPALRAVDLYAELADPDAEEAQQKPVLRQVAPAADRRR